MNKFNLKRTLALMIVMAISFSSCKAIEGIFTFGVKIGIVITVVVVVIIFWLVGKAKK